MSRLVAAAGGFEANIEWLKQYWGAAADNFLIRGTPNNRGTVLKLLLFLTQTSQALCNKFAAKFSYR